MSFEQPNKNNNNPKQEEKMQTDFLTENGDSVKDEYKQKTKEEKEVVVEKTSKSGKDWFAEAQKNREDPYEDIHTVHPNKRKAS